MQQVIFEDLGLIDYKKAWDYQEELFEKVMKRKMEGDGALHYLLFCEHPHVYTLGKSGVGSNLLISDAMLKQINATYYHINRGGDITYHGPGQIVVYPIFNLEAFGLTSKGISTPSSPLLSSTWVQRASRPTRSKGPQAYGSTRE
jgi:lipoyl(octanoyl) transferase